MCKSDRLNAFIQGADPWKGGPLPLPSHPLLFSPLPPLSLPSPSLRSRLPLIQLGGLGSAVWSPSGSVRSPAAKGYVLHFGLKSASAKSNFKYIFTMIHQKIDKFISKNAPKFFSHTKWGRRKCPLNTPLRLLWIYDHVNERWLLW